METRITGFSLRNVSEVNSNAISDIISTINKGEAFAGNPLLQSAPDADTLTDMLEQHRIEHGVSIGVLENGVDGVIGIAGLYYLEETALYEAVCMLLPEYQDATGYAIEFTIHDAFHNLGIDKICARAVPGSAIGELFKNYGFTSCGERVFMDDAQGQLWDYFELENEGNLVSAPQGGYAQSDWDNIF